MENLFKSKKINSFLLTMIMIISLFFFIGISGCSESSDEEGERIFTKIIYRPYSTSKPNGSDKTYGEIISENLLEVSSDILTRLVANYGIGEIEVKDGESTATVSPNINSVDYQSIFAISGSLSDGQKNSYALDMSKLTNSYLDSSNKIFIISNYSISSSDAENLVTYDADNLKYVAQSDLVLISNSGGDFSSGGDLESNAAYKYVSGNDFAYIFVGGYIGSNSSNNTFNNAGEAKTLLTKLLSTDFNSIQRKFDATTVVAADTNPHDIKFSTWNFYLTESEFSSVSTAEEFLAKYKEKYQLSVAVEIANAILTRHYYVVEDVPNSEDISYPVFEEYNALYEKASSFNLTMENKKNASTNVNEIIRTYTFDSEKSNSDKIAYLTYSTKYIDHIGLLSSEKSILASALIDGVSGGATLDLTKAENILSATLQNYQANPILEYITLSKVPIDDVEIKGYLQSIVFMSEAEYDMGDASVCFNFETKDENYQLNYLMAVRNSEGYFPETVEVEVEDGEWNFYLDAPKDGSKMDKFVDNLPSGLIGVDDTISRDLSQYFVYGKDTNLNMSMGCYWCFNDEEASFVEYAFATPDLFYTVEFKKLSLFIE